MSDTKKPNKSIDDLLAKKKTTNQVKTGESSDDLRKKMNRLVDANKVFDTNFDDKLTVIEKEKNELEKELKDINKKLKAIYNLKYDEYKVIDKKSDSLSKEILKVLDNAKDLTSEDIEKTEAMAIELESLHKQIVALKANNIASKKASEEAIAAANLAQEAATKARLAFEEKEKNANRDYKEEIEKLNSQLEDLFKKLNKSNVEKNKLKATIDSLKKANKEHLENLEKVENDLALAKQENENVSLKLAEVESQFAQNDLKIAKLNETKLNLKDNVENSQKEVLKQEAKYNKLLKEKLELKEKLSTLQKEFNKSNQKIEKLNSDKLVLSEQINELKHKLSSANSGIKKLENNIVKFENNKQGKLDELSALKKQNASLLKKLEKVEKNGSSKNNDDYEELKKLYDKKLNDLEKLQNDYNNALAEINSLNLNHESKIEEVKKDLLEKAKEEKRLLKEEHNKQVRDLNKDINVLIGKIKENVDKIEELKALKTGNQDKTIEDLSQKINSQDEKIDSLEKKNKKLEEENSAISSLKDEILKLNQNILDKQEKINELQNQGSSDLIVDEELTQELALLQEQFNETSAHIKKLKSDKKNVDNELKKAYKALREQENLLIIQDELINKQLMLVDTKDKQYKNTLIKIEVLEQKLFEAKKAYENEIDVLNIDKEELNKKLEFFKGIELKLNEANLQVQKQLIELEEKNNEIKSLKDLKEKNEQVIKNYLSEIEINEKKASKYLISVTQNEAYIEDIKKKMQNISQEYNSYRFEKEKELDSLKSELNVLKTKFSSVEDSAKQLDLAKFNEERLQSRIFELENSIKVLSLNENSKEDKSILESLDQYRTLLTNERNEHVEVESILSTKLNELNKEVEKLNNKFNAYTSSYMMSKLNKQISSLNELIGTIKTGNTVFNRDLYNEYYEDALRMYNEQKKIFNNEIVKRNEFLEIIRNEKEEEIKHLNLEVQMKGNNSIASGKLRILYQQVNDIDLIINSNVRTYSLPSIEVVESEILKQFKKDLIEYHKQMEENISSFEKNMDDEYKQIKSIEELLSHYSKDCLEMANRYSDDISKLYLENQFDSNDLSKLIREEKILMLVNEFQNLVRIRDEKYTSLQNKLSSVDIDVSFDDYNESLSSIEELKENLLRKLDSISTEEKRIKEVLYDERKRIFEDIESLNEQLNQLQEYSNDELIEEDKRKINLLLSGKREKLTILDEMKIPEIERKYKTLKDSVKASYDGALNEERAIKESFAARKNAIDESKEINSNLDNNIKKFSTFESINSILVDLNSIDKIYSDIKEKRKNSRPLYQKAKNEKANNLISKYKNLWGLYERYERAKKSMEEDFEEIRAYNNFKLEASSCYRKYCDYLKEIDLSEERYRSGLDMDGNIIKSLNAKANTFKSRVDYLNRQASDLLRYPSVNDYIELVNKIDQILNLIKQMDNEIESVI